MKRRVYDDEGNAQFVTFSCYQRRRLLDDEEARGIVVAMLAEELAKHEGVCSGFVVMPDHVHAILWFPKPGSLSPMMQTWKSRSSRELKRLVRGRFQQYAKSIDRKDPFWQAKYYPFNLFSEKKAEEKLTYMHLNPVRAGLVERACDWAWSSARYYEEGTPVGVPLEWIF